MRNQSQEPVTQNPVMYLESSKTKAVDLWNFASTPRKYASLNSLD